MFMAPVLPALISRPVTRLGFRCLTAFEKGAPPGEFASWAGIVLGLFSRPVLIAASEEQLAEARTRLARVGINDARGYLERGSTDGPRPGWRWRSCQRSIHDSWASFCGEIRPKCWMCAGRQSGRPGTSKLDLAAS